MNRRELARNSILGLFGIFPPIEQGVSVTESDNTYLKFLNDPAEDIYGER